MTSDPTEPDRPPPAPPGTIDLPLRPVGQSASASAGMGRGGWFARGPTDPPVGTGAPSSADPADDEVAAPTRMLGHRRQRVVAVGIALTALLSLVAVSLLYYRWATRAEPT